MEIQGRFSMFYDKKYVNFSVTQNKIGTIDIFFRPKKQRPKERGIIVILLNGTFFSQYPRKCQHFLHRPSNNLTRVDLLWCSKTSSCWLLYSYVYTRKFSEILILLFDCFFICNIFIQTSIWLCTIIPLSEITLVSGTQSSLGLVGLQITFFSFTYIH